MCFSTKFKQLRLEHGYTQKHIANLLGVKPTTVSAWELGNNTPRFDMLGKISQLFNVDTDYFINDEENKAKHVKVDLDDNLTIFTYQGKEIKPEDMEVVKKLLLGSRNYAKYKNKQEDNSGLNQDSEK